MNPKQLQDLIGYGGRQVKLSRALGIGDRHLRKYLSGKYPIPPNVAIAAHCFFNHSEDASAQLNEDEARLYALIVALWPVPTPRSVSMAARCLVLHHHGIPPKSIEE